MVRDVWEKGKGRMDEGEMAGWKGQGWGWGVYSQMIPY